MDVLCLLCRARPAERSRLHEAALAAAEGVFRDAVKAAAPREIREGWQADRSGMPDFRDHSGIFQKYTLLRLGA